MFAMMKLNSIWFRASCIFVALWACSENGASGQSNSSGTSPKASSNSNSNSAPGANSGAATAKLANSAPNYPGIESKYLNAAERKTFFKLMQEEVCPCGAQTFDSCLKKADYCPEAKILANFAIFQLRQGKNKEQTALAMLQELKNMNTVYQFNLQATPVKGPKNAPIQFVEFSDYECPHCSRFNTTAHQLQAMFPGQVSIAMKHYPLPMHPNAYQAALAAFAAQKQGKFWELHNLLFQNQAMLNETKIRKLAQSIKLNMLKFEADWKSPAAKAHIVETKKDGDRVNLTHTPMVFLNGKSVTDISKENLIEIIKATLNKK
jgi:protein-disulfide isomerase